MIVVMMKNQVIIVILVMQVVMMVVMVIMVMVGMEIVTMLDGASKEKGNDDINGNDASSESRDDCKIWWW